MSNMMTTQQAARFLDISVSWLNKSRMTGTGPAYLKIGGSVRYRQPDLEAWLSSRVRTAVYDHAQRRA